MKKHITTKHFIILIALAVIMFMSAGSLFADTIAYLDLDKIVANYPDAIKIQEELKTKGEALQKEFEEKQKEVEKAKEDKKEEKEIEEMVEKIKEELNTKRNEIYAYQVEAQKKILSKVLDTAKEVASEYGVDVILDKRVVYAGGFDLTDFVLEKLGK
ncbi:OmpH family outer membrane protein [Candidatus Margulisiibacteriota bacterium]